MRSMLVACLFFGACASTPRAAVTAELDQLYEEWSPRAAVIVVLDPRDGRIVAAEGRDAQGPVPGMAAERTWITGSTLKPLTWSAALDGAAIAPDTMIDCAPRTYAEGTLTDWKTFGTLSVRDALAVSSNVGASRVLDALGLPQLEATYRRLHVFDAPGTLPATDGLHAAMLAAGELAATSPLRMAAAYAAFFDAGRYHAPTSDGRGAVEQALSATTAGAMIELMANTVTSDLGTGKKAAIEGHRVAGKTGTAELADGHAYASFIGAVLDADPPRVILVALDAPQNGGTGGSAAAPSFARLARVLLANP